MSNFHPCFFTRVSPRHHKRLRQQQRRASLPWPSPILALTVFFFTLLNHGASIVDSLDAGGTYASPDSPYGHQLNNCDQSNSNCSPTGTGAAFAQPPPMPPGNNWPELMPTPPPANNTSPQPPNMISAGDSHQQPPPRTPPPNLEGTPTGHGSGENGKDQPQPKDGPQQSKRSMPKVVSTVGWVFLAAAAVMQVALGGFLAYKRWELEQYGVRLEKDPAT